MSKWFVYALVNRKSQDIRYIGCSKNPKRRLYDHGHNLKRLVGHWIATSGFPELVIVSEHGQREDAIIAERKCIHRAERLGFRLLNRASEPYYDAEVVKRTTERNMLHVTPSQCYALELRSASRPRLESHSSEPEWADNSSSDEESE